MILRLLSASILLLGLTGSVVAQTNPPRDPAPQQPSANAPRGQQSDNVDMKVAGCLILANANELAMADFAEGRIQNPQVKEFVTMLIADHEKALAKLQQLAPQHAQVGEEVRSEARQQSGNRTGGESSANKEDRGDSTAKRDDRSGNQQPSERTSTIPGAGGQDPMFEIEKDAAAKCRQMFIEELSSKSGTDFDKAFVGSQVGGHIHMIAKLEAVQPHVSPQLRPVIEESLVSTRKHLEKARELCKTLEGAKDADNEGGRTNPPKGDR